MNEEDLNKITDKDEIIAIASRQRTGKFRRFIEKMKYISVKDNGEQEKTNE